MTESNFFVPAAVDDAWNGYWTAGDVTMLAVDTTYTFDPTHKWLADIDSGARIGVAPCPTPTEADAVFKIGGLVIPSDAGRDLKAYWFFKDSGDEATSRLILYVRFNADNTLVSGTTDADGISIPFDPRGLFTVATVPV